MSLFQYKKFLIFGDSITEFAFDQHPERSPCMFTLGAALANAYTRKLDILQRGYSGYTSLDAVKMIGPILKYDHDSKPDPEKIALAYIFFGTNDARKVGAGHNEQHVDLPVYVSNMRKVVGEFQKRNIPVIVITPGLHDPEFWDLTYPSDKASGDTRNNVLNLQYANAVAEEFKGEVPVLHLYNVMESYLEKHPDQTMRDLLFDGIHMSEIGYKLIYNGLLKLIEENFPALHPEKMVQKFPHWSEIDKSADFE